VGNRQHGGKPPQQIREALSWTMIPTAERHRKSSVAKARKCESAKVRAVNNLVLFRVFVLSRFRDSKFNRAPKGEAFAVPKA
jgi:hypothetical protein